MKLQTWAKVIIALLYTSIYIPNVLGSTKIHTTNIGIYEGLAHGSVKGLSQDEDGLMWISTSGGINTYDGIDVCDVTVDNTIPIHSPLYGHINKDIYGNMWLQVSNDIVIYDIHKRQNTLLSEICPAIDFISPALTLTNNGKAIVFDLTELYILDWVDDHYELQKRMTSSSNITDVFYVTEDNILISTEAGTQLLTSNSISSISNISANFISMNGHTYAYSSEGVYLIDDKYNFVKLNSIPTEKIVLIQDTFWIATSSEVYSVDMVDGKMSDTKPKLHLRGVEINDILSDYDNQLWLATNNGIDIINPNRLFFNSFKFDSDLSNNDIRAVHEDDSENIWIGSWGENATLVFVPKGNFDKSIRVNIPLNKQSIHYIQSVGRDIYIASDKIIKVRWNGDYKSPKFSYTTILNNQTTSGYLAMVCRIDNKREKLWIGFFNGDIYRYSFADKKIEKLDISFTSHSSKPIGLRNIMFDINDNVWLATSNGLYIMDVQKSTEETPILRKYQYDSKIAGGLPYNYTLSILLDDTSVWIGTFGGGVFRSELDSSRLPTQFVEIQGLPNKIINSIEKDSKGDVWISTNKGICRYNTKSDNISVYNSQNSIWWLKFGELASATRRNGEMIFGYNGGVISFRDEAIIKDSISPKVYIKNFYLHNQIVEAGEEVNNRILLNKDINSCKKIELKYSENQFGLDFRAIHFINPTLTKCKYMLEGVDNDWILSDNENSSARYTSVPPGEYKFKVQGANSDNLWSNIHTIEIIVHKPFWRSNVALLCYLILMALTFYGFYKYATDRAKEKTILKFAETEKQRIENLAKMQNTFFTNISHEFRTPLSLILAPAKELKLDDSINAKSRSLIGRIDYNANILLRLINQLLDFSRFNDNKLKAEPTNENIVDFLQRALNQFADIATLQQVTLIFETSYKELRCNLDYNMLEQILYNLISNALKHTDEDGSIKLTLTKESADAIIMVSDTGSGIPQEIQASIFERFVTGNNGGTGIGLNFTKNLVEMNGGTISFETSTDGTTFTTKFSNAISEEAQYKPEESSTENISVARPAEKTSTDELTTLNSYLQENEEEEEEESKQTLLIVEDNASLREYLKNYFEKHYIVILAKNGAIGYNKAQEQIPDIIISDIMMPEMPGDKMCSLLKTDTKTSHIPIILLSALTSPSDNTQGYKMGADLYITKPFDIEVLSSALESLIENRRLIHNTFKRGVDIEISEVVANRSDEEIIKKAIDYIKENIQDDSLVIAKVAESVGLSYYLFNKKLQSILGLKGSALIRNIRLKYAAKMLLQSDKQVSEIVYLSGFSDIRHFRKLFFEMYNMTPSEYKRTGGE